MSWEGGRGGDGSVGRRKLRTTQSLAWTKMQNSDLYTQMASVRWDWLWGCDEQVLSSKAS